MNIELSEIPPEPGQEADLEHGVPGPAEPQPETEVVHREDLDTRDSYSDED